MAKYYIGNQTLGQYCKENGLNFATVRNRIYAKGLTPEEALHIASINEKTVKISQ